MDVAKELLQLKDKIEAAKIAKAGAEALLKSAQEKLSLLGYVSVEEAEKQIIKMKQELTQLDQELIGEITSIKTTYGL